MDILQEIYNVNYYVYEHYLDNELFYVGKGKDGRCLDFETRSKRWKAKVNGREEDIVIKVIETFKDEKDALAFEKERILELSKTNKLINTIFNNSRTKNFCEMSNIEILNSEKELPILLDEDKEMRLNKFKKIKNLENTIMKLSDSQKKESLKKELKILRNENHSKNALYLSEIIKKEKPKFKSNNLIIAPAGSGKTFFSKSLIKDNDHVLLLVSTTLIKNSLVSNDESEREAQKNRMYTTTMKNIYGEDKYKILVATYHEFGEKIKYTDDFAEQFDLIICDEIHSLPFHKHYENSSTLLGVIKYLFTQHENQTKYYFTSTKEHIDWLAEQSNEIMRNVSTFNYLNHAEIIKYVTLSSQKIDFIEKIKFHLKTHKKSFEYFEYKIFAFCKTLSSQIILQEICEKEGFSTQIYWSTDNERLKMTNKQTKELKEIIETGILPDEYDVVIINSTIQEGWDLIDPRVKLFIMNTTNETESTQSLGRLRRDLDILVQVTNKIEKHKHLSIPREYLDKQLTAKEKRELCESLDIRNRSGVLYKWETVSKVLKAQGFLIFDENSMINGKKTRTSTIHSR